LMLRSFRHSPFFCNDAVRCVYHQH
jgi:hypothetical protein